MKKRLLVYAHYFYPDVASTGQILTELCEGLQNEFDITVICVVPSYDGKVHDFYRKKRIFSERYKNINVTRVRVPEFNKGNKISRIKNILAYFFNAIYATFKVGKQDIVFSISQPPIIGGILGVIGKIIKRAKFVYNIQDFNPEQTMAIGYSKNKLLLNLSMYLDKFTCRRSDKIIVVGRDMQETLNKRFRNKKVPKSVVINNWIDEKQIYPLPEDFNKVIEFKNRYGLQNKFVFMYSGNIGLYYDLENIIKVIANFKNIDDIVFVFVGDGSIKQKLVNFVESNEINNVKFIPYQKKEDLIYSLNAADIHIVTNAKGIKGISVPSKIYGVMAAGKTVLGVLEEGSEARRIIEESNCGFCCNPGDYKGIEKLISKILKEKSNIKSIGLNGRKFIERNFTKDLSIKAYRRNLNNL